MPERVLGLRRTKRAPVSDDRKTSLPESAQECAASATIEAEPVTAAATDLVTAIRRLTPSATATVRALSERC